MKVQISEHVDSNHIKLYQVHLAWVGFELTTLVMIGTACIDNYKHNYHTITTTTVSPQNVIPLKIADMNIQISQHVDSKYKWLVNISTFRTVIY